MPDGRSPHASDKLNIFTRDVNPALPAIEREHALDAAGGRRDRRSLVVLYSRTRFAGHQRWHRIRIGAIGAGRMRVSGRSAVLFSC